MTRSTQQLRDLVTPKKAIKRQPRDAGETVRIYGGEERVKWIATRPCVACHRGPCENAHVKGGGVGRKADADCIVPLCGPTTPDDHIWIPSASPKPTIVHVPNGCHRLLHRIGQKTFERRMRIDLAAEAAKTEAAWQYHLAASQPPRPEER